MSTNVVADPVVNCGTIVEHVGERFIVEKTSRHSSDRNRLEMVLRRWHPTVKGGEVYRRKGGEAYMVSGSRDGLCLVSLFDGAYLQSADRVTDAAALVEAERMDRMAISVDEWIRNKCP